MKVVEVENLWKKFPGTAALKDVSFSIEQGVVVGLLGPNGSGKSTLLKILAGVMRPSKGRVRVLGSPLSTSVKERLAYVPEVDSLYRWMSVREYIDFLENLFPDWNTQRAYELMDFLKLEQSKKIYALSKGMRVRLKMLSALARESRLLLLDEPLSGIDPPSRESIVDVLVETFRMGEQTIIFSTHIVREAEKLFDRVIFLSEGRVTVDENAEDLRVKYGKSIQDLFKEFFS